MNRKGLYSFLSSVVVLIVGLLIGLIILFVSDSDAALGAFRTLITHGASDLRVVGNVLSSATPIILTGLSVTFAFKTGLFNIGATGQFTLGAFAAVYITLHLTFIPPTLRMITAIVAATLIGALWGAIPGLLKAFRNVHEVITCIMTNYIAMFLVTFLVYTFTFSAPIGRSYPAPA
jgi:simple sugar transport system permease protein